MAIQKIATASATLGATPSTGCFVRGVAKTRFTNATVLGALRWRKACPGRLPWLMSLR